jgi:hypothetical protein
VYSRYSSKHANDREEPGHQAGTPCFVTEAKIMADLLCQHQDGGCNRDTLMQKQRLLKQALDDLWIDVQSGRKRVGSVALLRMYKTLTFPMITERLARSEINHEGILREINLLINTFQYVLKPEQVK